MAVTSSPALSSAFSTAQELTGRIDTMQTTAKTLHNLLIDAVKDYDKENNAWASDGFPLPYKKVRNNYKHVKNETKHWIKKINQWSEELTNLKDLLDRAKLDFTELRKSKKDPEEMKKRKADDEKVNPQAAQELYESYLQINRSAGTLENKLGRIASTIGEIEERLIFMKNHPHSRRLTFLEMVKKGESYPSVLWNSSAKMMRYVAAATASYVSASNSTVEELSDDSEMEEDSPLIPNDSLSSPPTSFTQDTFIPQRNTPPFTPRTPSPSTQNTSTLQDTTCPSSLSTTSLPEPTMQHTISPSSSNSSAASILESTGNSPSTSRSLSPSTQAQDTTYPSLSSSPTTPVSSQTSISIQDSEPSSIANTPPPIPDILLAILGDAKPVS